MVLCGCAGIDLKNADDLLSEFLTDPIKERIRNFMVNQKLSLLVDIRNIGQCDKLLNIGGNFDYNYYAVFWKSEHQLVKCLDLYWDFLIKIWQKNPTENAMTKEYYKSCASFKGYEDFKKLKAVFDGLKTKGKWRVFVYGLFKCCFDHFIALLIQEMMDIAFEIAATKQKQTQIDSKDKRYLVHGMINATCNSLLRKYHYHCNKTNFCVANNSKDDLDAKHMSRTATLSHHKDHP